MEQKNKIKIQEKIQEYKNTKNTKALKQQNTKQCINITIFSFFIS